MKTWDVFLDGQNEPSFVVFEDDYDTALARAKRMNGVPHRTLEVKHAPERDWLALYHGQDKRLWNEAIRACSRLPIRFWPDEDGSLKHPTIRECIGVLIGITQEQISQMVNGLAPTPDAVRRKLKLIVSPHGPTLMIAKLRQAGLKVAS